MAEVKSDMGLDAVILQTRRLRQGGFLGVMASEVVEVTAAVDPDAVRNKSQAVAPTRQPAPPESAEDMKMMAVHWELANMRKTLENALASMQGGTSQQPSTVASGSSHTQLMDWAQKNDVEAEAAAALLQGISAQASSNDICTKLLRERIFAWLRNTSGITIRPGQSTVVAMVGPTGVGKTTTVAKLAANFALREKYRVALVTADTYRIAAVEQLKTYADLIGIPIEVIYTPQELKDAIQRHRDKHLVLIDTAGRSPANQPQMLELEELLAVDCSIEKHLVLSATTKFTECLDAVRRFKTANPQKYLFTKIDEACNLGTLLSLMHHVPRPLSYITTGQNVPDDIELADPQRLTNLILRGGI